MSIQGSITVFHHPTLLPFIMNLSCKNFVITGLKNMLKTAALAALIVFPTLSYANLAKFVHVRETQFWQSLYDDKYHTLYCAIHKKGKQDSIVTHIYPTAWMANAMNCASESDCNFARYKDASADLHNLWPAEPKTDEMRKHYVFFDGEESAGNKGDCNFITFDRGVEPRDYAKGEIARSMLYILWKYRLPDYEQLPLMMKWHNTYPVNAEERWRNEKINAIQGNENPFISDPESANKVFERALREMGAIQ